MGLYEEGGKPFREIFKTLILSLKASVFSVDAARNYYSLHLTNKIKQNIPHTYTIYSPVVLGVKYPKQVLLDWNMNACGSLFFWIQQGESFPWLIQFSELHLLPYAVFLHLPVQHHSTFMCLFCFHISNFFPSFLPISPICNQINCSFT